MATSNVGLLSAMLDPNTFLSNKGTVDVLRHPISGGNFFPCANIISEIGGNGYSGFCTFPHTVPQSHSAECANTTGCVIESYVQWGEVQWRLCVDPNGCQQIVPLHTTLVISVKRRCPVADYGDRSLRRRPVRDSFGRLSTSLQTCMDLNSHFVLRGVNDEKDTGK